MGNLSKAHCAQDWICVRNVTFCEEPINTYVALFAYLPEDNKCRLFMLQELTNLRTFCAQKIAYTLGLCKAYSLFHVCFELLDFWKKIEPQSLH